jgi:hypothetical protein
MFRVYEVKIRNRERLSDIKSEKLVPLDKIVTTLGRVHINFIHRIEKMFYGKATTH